MHDARAKPASEVYIVQVATIGGPKLGLPEDPAGAWIDHDVYFDREEAEQRARLHETSQPVDMSGRDITGEVVTVARVITGKELEQEFGADRLGQFLTVFRERLTKLMDEEEHQSG
jgi:hypothetical protein